jgi:hypothetical protein
VCGLNHVPPCTIILMIMRAFIDAPPSSLMDLTTSLKVKTTKGERVGARSLACSTSGVKMHVGASGLD